MKPEIIEAIKASRYRPSDRDIEIADAWVSSCANMHPDQVATISLANLLAFVRSESLVALREQDAKMAANFEKLLSVARASTEQAREERDEARTSATYLRDRLAEVRASHAAALKQIEELQGRLEDWKANSPHPSTTEDLDAARAQLDRWQAGYIRAVEATKAQVTTLTAERDAARSDAKSADASLAVACRELAERNTMLADVHAQYRRSAEFPLAAAITQRIAAEAERDAAIEERDRLRERVETAPHLSVAAPRPTGGGER